MGIPGARLNCASARANAIDPDPHLAVTVNGDLAIVSDTLSCAIEPTGLKYVSLER